MSNSRVEKKPTSDPGSSKDVQKPGTGTDITWAISLFGTAVGAGILFLPINAGANGLWPLLIVTILIGPMTYFAHRALSHFVCDSPRKGEDITKVAEGYFGLGWGRFITALYFLAIFPIVLIYGVSITNAVDSLMVNQLHMSPWPRWLLSGVLIGAMMLVMVLGQKLMLIVTSALVYPLILCLFGISLHLIPHWNFSGGLGEFPSFGNLLKYIWISIPVLVFAFNHSPAISQFSLAMQRIYGEKATKKASRVLLYTTCMLVVFTMLFVWSCVLTLGEDGLSKARSTNLPVLSYLANVLHTPVIEYLGPAIAIAAIVSSFFGHYLGAAEGAVGIVRQVAPSYVGRVGERRIYGYVAVFVFLFTWIVAIFNPSILDLIESLSGPVIASILYLMPMVAFYTVPSLKKYRHRASNIFVIVMGLLAVSAIIFKLVA